MPDIPDEKPARGRGTGVRGRGRGRGASASTPPASDSVPSERLGSIRNRPTSSTSSAPKMRFTPTVPARRTKAELSALLATSDKKPDIKREPKLERSGRGRGMRGGHRGEVVQVVAGPFAQGPASLGNNVSKRNMGSSFLAPSSGVVGSGGRAVKPGASLPGITTGGVPVDDMDVEGGYEDDANAPMLMLTDHNEALAIDEFAVQTEEMAIAAAEAMNQLNLDTTMAELFTRSADDEYEEEDRLMVFQLPGVPEFELDEDTLEARRRQRVVGKSRDAEDGQIPPTNDIIVEDVKPNLADLDAAADLMAMSVDVKPDLTRLNISDNEVEAAVDSDDTLVEGRIGTLVVLKSGAVKIRIGDILMDVSRGADCQFFRGLMALDSEGSNHTAFLLGNVDAVAMCTPDLESIL
ncbi:hypothetical protein GGI20_003252 [Coemansia sp. BCRC 34301]|nr:hypothetical protein GGI20_003252 [Coemansia sp. BCRC 34301]